MIRVLRHAARRLVRAPSFIVAAVLTLTLGIGGASAVFSMVDGILLRPLPYPHAEQLVEVSHTLQVPAIMHVDESDATYLLYRRENRVFTDVGAYRTLPVNVGGQGTGSAITGGAQRLQAAAASASLFRVLQASPQFGRGFSEADDAPGAPPVVLLGHALWENDFGGDRSIVGRRIAIDGVEREVVGVMPADLRFPAPQTALWLPLNLDPARTKSAAFDYRAVGRLRPGATVAAATVDLQRLLPRVPEVFPGRLTGPAITATHMAVLVRPLRDVIIGDVPRVLWTLLGAVGVLLLVSCGNVANLFLARAEARRREMTVRRALGAGRTALFGESLSEAALVSVVAAALGLVLGQLGIRMLRSAGAATIPRLGEVHVDAVVVAVTAAIAAFAALAISALPALRADAPSFAALLMAHDRSAGGATRQWVRRTLVVAQVALALVLLAGAGLLARSFARLRAVDPGFSADHALSFRVALPEVVYPNAAATAQLVVRATAAIRALPGVQAVGVTSKLPLDATGREDSAVFVLDHPLAMGQTPGIHQIVFAAPSYFDAMRIPLLAGRLFDAPDAGGQPAAGPLQVVVNAAFARQYWSDLPATSVIGKRVRMNATDPWATIVGVVGDVHDESLEQPPAPEVYEPLVTRTVSGAPWAPREVAFAVRTAGDPALIAPDVDRVMSTLDATLPLYRVVPMGALLSDAMARTTFTLVLLGLSAVVALLIGAVGIYGVIAYAVSTRTREIGVRLALGAQPADVRRLVAREGVIDSAVGIALGLGVAAVATRVLAALLFNVSPVDPLVLGGASVLLLVTAFAASWVPARRAAALDPAVALRAD